MSRKPVKSGALAGMRQRPTDAVDREQRDNSETCSAQKSAHFGTGPMSKTGAR